MPIFAIRMFIRGISLGALASSLLVAQDVAPHRPANTYHVPTRGPVPLVSPELHADRTVTFRVRAVGAPDVRLSLDGDHAMVKDSNGIWSVTLGPFEPEIYEYSFQIDGAKVIDTGNKFLKTGLFGASLLDVPSNPPRFDQTQFDPVHRCPCIREVGSNLHNLSRKVERGFGQLVEALYVVCRERQVQSSKVQVKLLHRARADISRLRCLPGENFVQIAETVVGHLPAPPA